MMSTAALKEPKQSVIANGRKRIHSKFVDGSEMIEEYDVVTDELLLRKLRRPTAIGGEGPWVIEVGSEGVRGSAERDGIVESISAPQLSRQDTAEDYVFRIRNLNYPKDVFSINVEQRSGSTFGSIIVRTNNKKYFKVIEISDLQRAQIALDPASLSWDIKFDTLVIKYKKPMSIRIVEAQEKKERAAIASTRVKDPAEQQRCDQQ